MTISIKMTSLWIMKSLLKVRENVNNLQEWSDMQHNSKFHFRKMYLALLHTDTNVSLRTVMFNNITRSRVIHTFWMVCHKRLATKERLVRFGMLSHDDCCFRRNIETQEHLLLSCSGCKNKKCFYIWP